MQSPGHLFLVPGLASLSFPQGEVLGNHSMDFLLAQMPRVRALCLLNTNVMTSKHLLRIPNARGCSENLHLTHFTEFSQHSVAR